jgi:uncharacterized membrane protein
MNPPRTLHDLTRQNVDAIIQMEKAEEEQRTRGERVADAVTAAVGSWPFLVIQSCLLVVWVVLNVMAWSYKWDPYPFILLNLLLSFQAAYTSPIILMSQNRQTKIADRRNHLDLQINLLAEQEATETLRLLRKLCQKLDVPLEGEATLKALAQATQAEDVLRQIEQSAKSLPNGKSKGSAG